MMALVTARVTPRVSEPAPRSTVSLEFRLAPNQTVSLPVPVVTLWLAAPRVVPLVPTVRLPVKADALMVVAEVVTLLFSPRARLAEPVTLIVFREVCVASVVSVMLLALVAELMFRVSSWLATGALVFWRSCTTTAAEPLMAPFRVRVIASAVPVRAVSE